MGLKSIFQRIQNTDDNSDVEKSLLIVIPGGRSTQIPADNYPGQFRYWYPSLEAIAQGGIELTVASRYWVAESNELPFQTASATVLGRTVRLPGGRHYNVQIPGFATLRLLARTRARVFLVVEYTPTTLLALVMARVRRRKIWIFQEASRERHSVSLRLERFLASKSDMVVAGFGSAERDIRSRIGLRESMVEHISLIAPPPNSHMMSEPWNPIIARGNNVVFLSVARLIPLKNIETLIHAAHLVKQRGYSFDIWMVGKGELKASLTELVVDKGLIDDFRWIGEVRYSSIGHVFDSADVFVFPSRYDLYGMAAVEALRFGLPVISSSGAGVSGDLVIHEDNGFVFDPDSPQELADYMIRLITNPELRTRMSARSLELIEAETAEIAASRVRNLLMG